MTGSLQIEEAAAIRRAQKDDRNAIFNIWRVCFGDTEDYINFFLNNAYEPSSCLVWEEDGSPVAMLHMFYADYKTKSGSFPVQYIYAAATLPEYRRRGIMGRLVESAVNFGAEKGCLFTFLLPANDKLYDFYAELGFKTAFSIQKVKLNRGQLEKSAIYESPVFLEPDVDKLYNLRQAYFKPAVLWHRKKYKYVISEWQFTGGNVLFNGTNYALCREYNDKVIVKEACGPFSEIAAMILSYYKNENFTFFLPPYEKLPFNSEILRYGMLKPSDKNSKIINKIKNDNPYVNLLLE